MDIPTLDKVASVFLAVSVESVVDTRLGERAEHEARLAVRHYMNRISEVVSDDHVDISEEPEDSGYDSEWQSFSGSFYSEVTVEQWLKIADGYCLDLDWIEERDEDDKFLGRYRTDDLSLIPAVPEDVVPTMGTLTAEGLIPAVSIPYTDEGWGAGGYEPILIASFYVSLLMKE